MHNNLLIKDSNVDISIQRVDELHLHHDGNGIVEVEEEEEDAKDSGHRPAASPKAVAKGNNESKIARKFDGAEVPVQDMHDGRDMFDSSVSNVVYNCS
jgi:hypothetical protein